jgi:hypothetical protein
MLGHVRLILPHIHIVKPRFIAGLLLDLLSYLAAGKDSATMERTIDCPETALIDLVPALQTSIMSIWPVGSSRCM